MLLVTASMHVVHPDIEVAIHYNNTIIQIVSIQLHPLMMLVPIQQRSLRIEIERFLLLKLVLPNVRDHYKILPH
jgi:hypothetical protein